MKKHIEPILTTGHPVAQCVDLKATFGHRYRVERDESYGAESPERRKVEAAWLTVIPCRFGQIFPWGGQRLAAYSSAGAVKRRQLEQLGCVQVAQGGGAGCPEVIVTFDLADFDAVAAVLQPRKRRQYSPEARAVLVARLARVRPSKNPVEIPYERATCSTPGATNARRARGKAGRRVPGPKSPPTSGLLAEPG